MNRENRSREEYNLFRLFSSLLFPFICGVRRTKSLSCFCRCRRRCIGKFDDDDYDYDDDDDDDDDDYDDDYDDLPKNEQLCRWEHAMHQILFNKRNSLQLNISEHLRQALLLQCDDLPRDNDDNDDDDDDDDNDDNDDHRHQDYSDLNSLLIDDSNCNRNRNCDDDNDDSDRDVRDNDTVRAFLGLPNRPYYKALARRIYHLSFVEKNNNHRHRRRHQNNNDVKNLLLENVTTTPRRRRPFLSSELLGFSEIPCRYNHRNRNHNHDDDDDDDDESSIIPPLPSRPTVGEITKWLRRVGDHGILEILGMRRTVGTDPRGLLPPSRFQLLNAAAAATTKTKTKTTKEGVYVRDKNRLSVAARARAKHAHRGKERFFGIVRGNNEEQSRAAQKIVLRLLNDAVWTNIHTFGGMPKGYLVFEVRIASGYGARWRANYANPVRPREVTFRGFLEPQMPDGHEKGWKH